MELVMTAVFERYPFFVTIFAGYPISDWFSVDAEVLEVDLNLS